MAETAPILLVEDNHDDVFFMERAARKAGLLNPLKVVGDGQAAVDYLEAVQVRAEGERNSTPALVLLDLKLPYRGGLEVLQWIRNSSVLKPLPVIIISSSAERSDVDKAYRLGANGYLVKPANLDGLVNILQALKSFWFTHNLLPSISGQSSLPPDADASLLD